MKIISCHIPKCAGFSMQKHLLHIWGAKRVFWDYNHTDRPDYDGPEPIKPLVLKALWQSQKPAIVHGHFFMRKYNPGHLMPAVYRVVWLRDPVDRLLSHYHYWQNAPDPDHPLCRQLVEEKLSAAEFAKLPVMRNYFNRFLSGVALEDFDFIGLVDRFDESITLFYQMFATDKNPHELGVHLNRNEAKGKEGYEISGTMRKQIEAANGIDLEFYQRACERFETILKRHE